MSAANLRAFMYGLSVCRDSSLVPQLAQSVKIQDFKPRSGVRIAETEAAAEAMLRQASSGGTNADIAKLDVLRKLLPSTGGLHLAQFKVKCIPP
ncbi:unnamed protein product [Protopolystoma xenopodis]|uniref:Ubiquitin-activating enzyme SCCH domain-containing protein n=1 Tax=Protopolystoma xenopodis TaxID=117903 RepID=A0A3S4ZPA0_9PLAT|nr:unnamed protein product [Protopolystoma xenopodis]